MPHNRAPMRRALTGSTRAALLLSGVLAFCSCRIESAAPGAGSSGPELACTPEPSGDLWVYTSMYRQVIDDLEPLLKQRLPKVKVHWYQAGSEKVANRLEAEHAAGAIRADVIATSDPFLYARLADEGAFLRYASPWALRVPRSLMDLDARWTSARLSTMVLAFREGQEDSPASFAELTQPKWRGRVAIGDPLLSGTAFTWSVFLEQKYGAEYFQKLRENGAVVAGGNAAVQQKVESGEVDVGVLLLENVLSARERGSPLTFRYPEDGAVVVPGPVAIFESTANPQAAKAFVDVLLSPEGQAVIVEGDMHAVDPRLQGPAGQGGVSTLMENAQPWSDQVLQSGVKRGAEIKDAFTRAFSK